MCPYLDRTFPNSLFGKNCNVRSNPYLSCLLTRPKMYIVVILSKLCLVTTQETCDVLTYNFTKLPRHCPTPYLPQTTTKTLPPLSDSGSVNSIPNVHNTTTVTTASSNTTNPTPPNMNSMTLAMSNVNVGLKQFRKMIKKTKKPKNKNEGDNKSIDRYFCFLFNLVLFLLSCFGIVTGSS